MVPKVIPDSPESPVNYWINDLRLYFEDKQILQENEDLNDRHITATITIIAAQFPDLPPVQSSLRTQKISLLQSGQDNSLFFHNYNHHWALTYFNEGVVHLYDSLQPAALHCDLHEQISALYKGISVVRLEQTQLQMQRLWVLCNSILYFNFIWGGAIKITLQATGNEKSHYYML